MAAATAAVELSMGAPLSMLVEALEAADSVRAALDPQSRSASLPAQYWARDTTAATGQATTTIHMPTITATTAVTITGMPLATASSASQEQFSGVRTAAGTFASNEFESARLGAFLPGRERAETIGTTFRGDCLTAFIESHRDRTTASYSIRRHDLQ
jgi:hypothetical protein